jgi:hypothetical protein
VRSNGNALERAVVSAGAVVFALLNSTLNALVFVAAGIHVNTSFSSGFGNILSRLQIIIIGAAKKLSGKNTLIGRPLSGLIKPAVLPVCK